MRLRNIASALIAALCVNASAQTTSKNGNDPIGDRPKMVVNIVVDGLRADYIEQLWDDLSDGGFRKVIINGAYARSVEFPYPNVGRAADYATIFTGTLPTTHGICADSYLDRATRKPLSCLHDEKSNGIGTDKKISSKELLASTITDELRLNTRGKGKIVSIGIDAEQTAIMAGHSSSTLNNKTVWLSDADGKWATTSYFSQLLPFWAVRANGENQIGNYLDRNWSNLFSVAYYKEHSAQKPSSNFFSYDFMNMDPAIRIRKFKHSPYANTIVKEMAVQAVKDEYLGVDLEPDMLNLQFTVRGAEQATAGGQMTAEVQDMYYRLDLDLNDLINDIDELCGTDEVLYVITAPQEEYVSPERLKAYGIPSGYFVSDRSMSLLSTYLMAKFGQGDFIAGYYHRQIFLDKMEIEQKGLDFDSVANMVTAFMRRFEGVSMAFRAEDLETASGYNNTEVAKAKNTFCFSKSGDIIIYLQPGWVDVEREEEKAGLSSRVNAYVPLIMYGWNIKSKKIKEPVSILDIASTVADVMLLPMTNGNGGKPIYDIYK